MSMRNWEVVLRYAEAIGDSTVTSIQHAATKSVAIKDAMHELIATHAGSFTRGVDIHVLTVEEVKTELRYYVRLARPPRHYNEGNEIHASLVQGRNKSQAIAAAMHQLIANEAATNRLQVNDNFYVVSVEVRP